MVLWPALTFSIAYVMAYYCAGLPGSGCVFDFYCPDYETQPVLHLGNTSPIKHNEPTLGNKTIQAFRGVSESAIA